MTMPDYDEMGMPERVYVAPGMPGWPGVWTEEREDDESVPYTRSDLVSDAVKALEEARRDMRNAWGAVTSNQVEDKDVAGGLRSAMGLIDAALARIDALKETVNG